MLSNLKLNSWPRLSISPSTAWLFYHIYLMIILLILHNCFIHLFLFTVNWKSWFLFTKIFNEEKGYFNPTKNIHHSVWTTIVFSNLLRLSSVVLLLYFLLLIFVLRQWHILWNVFWLLATLCSLWISKPLLDTIFLKVSFSIHVLLFYSVTSKI